MILRLRIAGTGLAALLVAAAVAAQPDIRINQLGFQPESSKHAIAVDTSTATLPWSVTDSAGAVVARGQTTRFGEDAASGDHVHAIDLSEVTRSGEYRLAVNGAIGRSFVVAPDIYTPLARAALNYFYQTRAGIPIEARFAGGALWARPAGHPHEVAPCFAGTDESGTLWPGCGGYTRDVTGGWYDAGDQGKYVVNGGIALWTLQNLYELQRSTPQTRRFSDGAELVPRQGRLDPLLVEARWEMDFLLAMQVPDNMHMQLPVGRQPPRTKLTLSDVDASGMAHHKVADRQWTPLPTPPHKDSQPRLLYPPTTAATLNLAATAAQCARLWRPIDPAYADLCLKAATRAFAAAQRNPDIFTGDFTGSGGYGDGNLADEFYWAAAELFATTHDPKYGDVVRQAGLFTAAVREPNWGSVAALGTITLAISDGALTLAEQGRQRALITTAADGFLAEEAQSGYRIPYATTAYPWGSNASILNRAMLLALAERFASQTRYRGGAVDAMDYVLGRNPLDVSYVSGFGARAMHNPHHRFWAHALDSRLPPPPPGVLSGGPNNTAMADDIARTMKGKCAAQRCWRDEVYAYALNEVAINWNAPLLWVAAYLDETR
ncbi:glycoside hydrolase family 9 protein [Sphingomonas crusticola]|uniref:glycoside hydrolase family 9 protein n=1 Tax=Sphingomonas crusticola TaxID=1697973 RepID=UPI000E233D19|nr:glycoside hydrolase family 9 protein [Sphingomonas crusticola]